MKTKIVLVMFFIVTILCSTVAIATENADLDLDAVLNANIEDLVGEDESTDLEDVFDSENAYMPISDDFLNEYANQGDLFVFQTNANVEEDVNGNLYVFGDNVNISANVDGNVFVVGRNVTLNSEVSGSAYIATENLKFDAGYIRDAYFVASNISMAEETIISREAKMVGEKITISGMILGNTYTTAENIELKDKGAISGLLVYTGDLEQSYEGQVGSIQKIETSKKEELENENVIVESALSIIYSTFTALFITGIIVLAINKKPEVKVTVSECLTGALKGLLFAIVIPIISIVLLITVIGIPFSIILLLAYILMYFIVIPAVCVQISAYISDIKGNDSKVFLWLLATVIFCALAIIRKIPVLGGIITVLVGVYGFNLVIKTIFNKKKKEEVVTE